ncbi:MAG: hypothetical protein KGL58_04195 [Pseudomonadota bacterium]|nr:hypothetical protein [Pseudomonadota bacterium]
MGDAKKRHLDRTVALGCRLNYIILLFWQIGRDLPACTGKRPGSNVKFGYGSSPYKKTGFIHSKA